MKLLNNIFRSCHPEAKCRRISLKKILRYAQNDIIKVIIIIIIFLFLLLTQYHVVLAAVDFKTYINSSYKISEKGEANVTQEITLINQKPDLYVAEYSLTIPSKNVQDIQSWDRIGPLTVKLTPFGQTTKINLSFNEKVVGMNQTLSFILKYKISGFSQKEGRIWRVTLPKNSSENLPDEARMTVSVPESFGRLAFASIPAINSEVNSDKTKSYFFEKENFSQSGVLMLFGDYQVYDFKLIYNLISQSGGAKTQVVALPPSTNYQQVFYESILPRPENVQADDDGNWLATFLVSPSNKLTIEAKGKVRVFSSPLTYGPEFFISDEYTKSKPFWETDNPEIKKAAAGLKTPREIYNFVVKTLFYDFSGLNGDKKRYGAASSLLFPNKALCLEFTDLFVALARQIGIPAREIEGYAFTENLQSRPISLTSDILHAWPEFYDKELKTWKMVDPTWDKTSGFDYFENFDLSHFTFVIHGLNSSSPYPPGSYKIKDFESKDVIVELGEDVLFPDSQISINIVVNQPKIWEKTLSGFLEIGNSGGLAKENLTVIQEGGKNSYLNQSGIKLLLPYGKERIDFHLANPIYFFSPYSLKKIDFDVGGQKFTKNLQFINWRFVYFLPLLAIIPFIFLLIFLKGKRKKG